MKESGKLNIKQYWKKFESLSMQYVQEKYCINQDYQFIQTRYQKDGGFDAEHRLEIFKDVDGVRTLLEAKLRSSNLGLRDISASVIIAYNLGAYCIFIVTNHNCTPQLVENVETFKIKTNLKIRLIGGSELAPWIKQNWTQLLEEDFPEKLLELFCIKQQISQIANMQHQKLEQAITLPQVEITKGPLTELIFLSPRLENIVRKITNQLVSAKAPIIVKGAEGVGKSVVIRLAIDEARKKGSLIRTIDMAECTSSRLLFLQLMSNACGLESYEIIFQLNDDEIELIADIAGQNCSEDKLVPLLRHILTSSKDQYESHSDINNYLLIQYLCKLLEPYALQEKYVFYFHNLEHTPPEVLDFLRNICENFEALGIPTLIELRTPLTTMSFYDFALWEKYVDLFESIATKGYIISLEPFSSEEACNFLMRQMPGIDNSRAQVIVESVGRNPLILSTTVRWLFEEKIIQQYSNNQYLVDNFKVFFNSICPEDGMEIVSRWIKLLEVQYKLSVPFAALSLFDGNMPVELLIRIIGKNEGEDSIEYLLKSGIAKLNGGNVVLVHKLIYRAISETVSEYKRWSVSKAALPILSEIFLDSERVLFKSIELNRVLGQWQAVLSDGFHAADMLAQNYQFNNAAVFYRYATEATEKLLHENSNSDQQVRYLKVIAAELENMVSLNLIADERSLILIQNMKKAAFCLPKGGESDYYSAYADYFQLKHYAELYDLKASSETYKRLVPLVEQNPDKFCQGDLTGKILSEGALVVKSIHGYQSAMKAYEDAKKIASDSILLEAGRLSHLACVELCWNPINARNYYHQIIILVKQDKRLGSFPLFHEYGDVAMTEFLAKDYESALQSAERANELARSNGVWTQQGRAENIIACIYWAKGDDPDRIAYHFEKSCFLLEKSDAGHYLWRSRLNLAAFYSRYIEANPDKGSYALSLLNSMVSAILKTPKRLKYDIESRNEDPRRYSAALQAAKAYLDVGYPEQTDKLVAQIPVDTFDSHLKMYCQGTLSEKELGTSALIHGGQIMSVG